ncbi:MAG: hypothetical protein JSU72_17750 [Deltaproteobacteria bacterium]|nr:MAG: hypothetical protein JSU72_17750 [Deltaproteobacteria bacterium]
MEKKNTKDGKSLTRLIDFFTIAPAIGGMILAAIVFAIQLIKWSQRGEWEGMPIAGFMPQGLVQWAVSEQGGMLGLKKVVLSFLSLHASVWFIIVGWTCTVLVYELTKNWRKDEGRPK